MASGLCCVKPAVVFRFTQDDHHAFVVFGLVEVLHELEAGSPVSVFAQNRGHFPVSARVKGHPFLVFPVLPAIGGS